MILVTRVSQLNPSWRQAINNLILGAFKESRLDEYEEVVCYYVGDEVIGVMGLNHIMGRLCLNQLVVGGAYRHQGIASLLLGKVFGRHGGSDMILYVDKHGLDADFLMAFYARRGFNKVRPGEIQGLQMDDQMEVLMLKRGIP
jgi:ribosomal protein S18 acetylase RimI-like enzyme